MPGGCAIRFREIQQAHDEIQALARWHGASRHGEQEPPRWQYHAAAEEETEEEWPFSGDPDADDEKQSNAADALDREKLVYYAKVLVVKLVVTVVLWAGFTAFVEPIATRRRRPHSVEDGDDARGTGVA